MANSEFKVFEFEEDDITKDKKYKDLIDKRVGALPRAVLVGPSEAGKTQFIHNVLWQWCKDYYFKNDSSKIIVVSGTQTTINNICKMAQKFDISEDQLSIYKTLDWEELDAEYRSMDPKVPNLFIFDDMAYNKAMNTNHATNLLSELFASGRHKRCGCIIATQKYYYLGQDVRMLNSNLISLYWNANDKECWKVYDENFSQFMNEDEFKDLVFDHLSEKYSFILINKKTGKVYNNKMEEIFDGFSK